jgi:hypothetical protein
MDRNNSAFKRIFVDGPVKILDFVEMVDGAGSCVVSDTHAIDVGQFIKRKRGTNDSIIISIQKRTVAVNALLHIVLVYSDLLMFWFGTLSEPIHSLPIILVPDGCAWLR